VTVRSGAPSRELVGVVGELPASFLVDAVPIDRHGGGAVLTFRHFPAGAVCGSAPWSGPGGSAGDAVTVVPGEVAGWVPDLGPAAGPDRGFTPFDLAVSELLRAARDGAAGAWIMTVVRLVPPAAVVALADLVRDGHGRACGCRNGCRRW